LYCQFELFDDVVDSSEPFGLHYLNFLIGVLYAQMFVDGWAFGCGALFFIIDNPAFEVVDWEMICIVSHFANYFFTIVWEYSCVDTVFVPPYIGAVDTSTTLCEPCGCQPSLMHALILSFNSVADVAVTISYLFAIAFGF
jgi:hypothetical protein